MQTEICLLARMPVAALPGIPPPKSDFENRRDYDKKVADYFRSLPGFIQLCVGR